MIWGERGGGLLPPRKPLSRVMGTRLMVRGFFAWPPSAAVDMLVAWASRLSAFDRLPLVSHRPHFFFIFMPFVASPRHRPAGPGVAGWGPGLRGGVQCRAKPEAGYELSLYSLAGPTSMATCLLHCRPRDGEAPCTVAQRLRYGMFLPPPPMGRHAGRARAVGVLVAERPRTPCPPVGPGKHSGRRVK